VVPAIWHPGVDPALMIGLQLAAGGRLLFSGLRCPSPEDVPDMSNVYSRITCAVVSSLAVPELS